MDDRLVSESTTIDAPPAVVFAIVADPRQHPRIDGSGSVQGIITGPERLEKGATFGVSMRLFGLPYTIRNRVVEFEQDRLIAWKHFGPHRWRYELAPTDDGVYPSHRDLGRHPLRLPRVRRPAGARLPGAQPRRDLRHAGPVARGRRGRPGSGPMTVH